MAQVYGHSQAKRLTAKFVKTSFDLSVLIWSCSYLLDFFPAFRQMFFLFFQKIESPSINLNSGKLYQAQRPNKLPKSKDERINNST